MSLTTETCTGRPWMLLLLVAVLLLGTAVSREDEGGRGDYFGSPETDEEEPGSSAEERPAAAAKRALSLFANWRPHYAGGPADKSPGSDFVSAVARGGAPSRPLGQPLRWG